ncbi:circadian clock protein KaiC [Synechocystis salina]|uniref:non-specific serine/threonine protein kinase n=1 Tax=Synechocystis salina LEGE 00031 TaxID=1828736 RepID=A0ABR9VWA8_9SYNC|nr:circadian clock protein KaiC [Synechocystis salina]MBE9242604.1 circadian clock protein KaiC [Synechocystis salina LEGE 00041]MBE9255644.1 circadian clock protein KaiC [Synechocystis salina LEGE 00031]
MTDSSQSLTLIKCPTGIQGFDEITNGGLPQARPTLICGSAGCGKTLFGVEFLVRGAIEYEEPGVLVTFEESAKEITQNVASLGWDLQDLIAKEKIFIDHIYVEASEIEETGEYDLEALFIRLGYAINKIGAKRILLDTIEVLFSGLDNANIVRSELRRLFHWLKEKGVTAIITGERGDKNLTRQGLEEYVSDCVIKLDQKTVEEIATRTIQVVKYRGSRHSNNEYPFLIEENGISVLPITSLVLNHSVSQERISTGIPQLDEMFGGQGYYRGSSILATGRAGTGKTTLASFFAQATCLRGERCLYLATEESPQQICRNLRSIGLDLSPYLESELLQFDAIRPTNYNLEMRLFKIHSWVRDFKPSLVIVDPMSNLIMSGSLNQTKNFFMRLIDYLKSQQITVFLTDLTGGNVGYDNEQTEIGVSSLMDTWLELQTLKVNGERNRILYILKSRGMMHSNQVREFILSSDGVDLIEAYIGDGQVLTGTQRINQMLQEEAIAKKRQQVLELEKRNFERKKYLLQAEIDALQMKLTSQDEELEVLMLEEEEFKQTMLANRNLIQKSRHIH